MLGRSGLSSWCLHRSIRTQHQLVQVGEVVSANVGGLPHCLHYHRLTHDDLLQHWLARLGKVADSLCTDGVVAQSQYYHVGEMGASKMLDAPAGDVVLPQVEHLQPGPAPGGKRSDA